MRSARPVEAWLRDIVTYGARLARHLHGVSQSEFLVNETIQDAVAKCVEAIGEAAGHIARLEPDLESRYPDLRLSDAYSVRNRLSHGYHSIDTGVLWTTAMKSIPATVEAARIALAECKENGPGGRPLSNRSSLVALSPRARQQGQASPFKCGHSLTDASAVANKNCAQCIVVHGDALGQFCYAPAGKESGAMTSAARVTRAAGGLPRRRFTVAEVEAMVAAGVMNEHERVELIGGELVPMSPKGSRHEVVKKALNRRWIRRIPDDIDLIPETTFRLSEDTYVEPDFVVYPLGIPLERLTA